MRMQPLLTQLDEEGSGAVRRLHGSLCVACIDERGSAGELVLRNHEANRVKDEFLSTLSHELRTPMTSVLGWAQMMRMMKLDEETMATAVATIERGTYAQIRLIDDLLDISRITNGRLRLEERLFRLPALVAETLDVIRPASHGQRDRRAHGPRPGAGDAVWRPGPAAPSDLESRLLRLVVHAAGLRQPTGRPPARPGPLTIPCTCCS
jgi:signal transduction histidine kinase